MSREFINSLKGNLYRSDNLGLCTIIGSLKGGTVKIRLLDHPEFISANADLTAGYATTTVSAIRRYYDKQKEQSIMSIIKHRLIQKGVM